MKRKNAWVEGSSYLLVSPPLGQLITFHKKAFKKAMAKNDQNYSIAIEKHDLNIKIENPIKRKI